MSLLLTKNGLLVVRNGNLVTVEPGGAATCDCCEPLGPCGIPGTPPSQIRVSNCLSCCSVTALLLTAHGTLADFEAAMPQLAASNVTGTFWDDVETCYMYWFQNVEQQFAQTTVLTIHEGVNGVMALASSFTYTSQWIHSGSTASGFGFSTSPPLTHWDDLIGWTSFEGCVISGS